MPLIEKLFVWSIVLEPMMFFVVADRAATGVSGNLSRLLQIVVLAGLGIRVLAGTFRYRHDPRFAVSRLYFPHFVYLGIALVAGLLGAYWGAYAVPGATTEGDHLSGFSLRLNSATVRPLFEYLIAGYYFAYFIVLPAVLLNTPRKVGYFLQVFKGMFLLSLVVGFVDVAFAAINIDLVPRHLAEGRHVGVRYHGLAGEPRDAFVFLVFGFAMYYLAGLYQRRRVPVVFGVAVLVAMALTHSASGLIGLVLGAGIAGLYALRTLRPRQIAMAAGLAVASVGFSYVLVISSARLMDYTNSAAGAWHALQTGEGDFGVFGGQMTSIFPVFDLAHKAASGDLVPVLIGSGLGSASAVNNRYMGTNELANPASQLIRTLYEVGLIGTIFFMHSFVGPTRRLSRALPPRAARRLQILMFVLLGCFFAHRSATVYIYLGMLVCIFRVAAQPRQRAALARQPMPAIQGGPA